MLNEIEYLSRQELMGDIQLILEQAIKSEMGIDATEFPNYTAVLVIPDLFEKAYVHEMTRLLFQDMGFSKVAFLQVTCRPNPRSDCRNLFLQHLEQDYHTPVSLTSAHKLRQ